MDQNRLLLKLNVHERYSGVFPHNGILTVFELHIVEIVKQQSGKYVLGHLF